MAMDTNKLCATLKTYAPRLPAIVELDMEEFGDSEAIQFTFHMIPPREEANELFKGFASYSQELEHPLFGEPANTVEVHIPTNKLDPSSSDYIEEVKRIALPYVDHHRFCPGVSAKWNPEQGTWAVFSRIRDYGQSDETLSRQTFDAIRDCVALIYLERFKVLEGSLTHELGAETASPILTEILGKMHGLLGITDDDDNID